MHFKNFKLINPIIRAITETPFNKPTIWQGEVIDTILHGKDIMGVASADDVRTNAVVLPTIQLLKQKDAKFNSPGALVLSISDQGIADVDALFTTATKYLPCAKVAISQDDPSSRHLVALSNRVDVVIANPMTIISLLQSKKINLSQTEIIILDGFDQLLSKGYFIELQTIMSMLPKNKQTIVLTETMNKEVLQWSDAIGLKPQIIKDNKEYLSV